MDEGLNQSLNLLGDWYHGLVFAISIGQSREVAVRKPEGRRRGAADSRCETVGFFPPCEASGVGGLGGFEAGLPGAPVVGAFGLQDFGWRRFGGGIGEGAAVAGGADPCVEGAAERGNGGGMGGRGGDVGQAGGVAAEIVEFVGGARG